VCVCGGGGGGGYRCLALTGLWPAARKLCQTLYRWNSFFTYFPTVTWKFPATLFTSKDPKNLQLSGWLEDFFCRSSLGIVWKYFFLSTIGTLFVYCRNLMLALAHKWHHLSDISWSQSHLPDVSRTHSRPCIMTNIANFQLPNFIHTEFTSIDACM
jgi:hypothetical protein